MTWIKQLRGGKREKKKSATGRVPDTDWKSSSYSRIGIIDYISCALFPHSNVPHSNILLNAEPLTYRENATKVTICHHHTNQTLTIDYSKSCYIHDVTSELNFPWPSHMIFFRCDDLIRSKVFFASRWPTKVAREVAWSSAALPRSCQMEVRFFLAEESEQKAGGTFNFQHLSTIVLPFCYHPVRDISGWILLIFQNWPSFESCRVFV